MQINILHRPEPDGYRKAIFKMQQEMVHALGMPVTVLATAPSLEDADSVQQMKTDAAEHGDEIGLSFHSLNTPEVIREVGYEEVAFWLYDEADKRKVIRLLVNRFVEVFGEPPKSAAAYHFDASSLRILKEVCPSVEAVVGGCFEEGVRVYHGCNNSWYLFNEGMPWGPWFPSKSHSLRPAKDEDDWAGVVAVPHLSRDMVLAYEGRNDFWASHPPNVQRGMGNVGEDCPYDKNLIDQHRFQERFNGGYSYLNVFVSAQWLIHNHNSEEPPEVSVSLYRQQLEYIKSLIDAGEASASTMSEFGAWYRQQTPIDHAEVCLAKEVLYGSGKHLYWHIDPRMRVLVDLSQGGSIGDLRPYLGETEISTGRDTPHGVYGSYPYVVQSQHRTGYLNHFSDGSRSTAILRCGEIEVDMADVDFRCAEVLDDQRGFVTNVATVSFGETATAKLRQTFLFQDDASVVIERELLELTGDGAQELEIREIFKGCCGITEYPEDLTGVTLTAEGETPVGLEFDYKRRCESTPAASRVEATVPQAGVVVGLRPDDGAAWDGEIAEGILFNPYYTLTLRRTLQTREASRVCLYLRTTK